MIYVLRLSVSPDAKDKDTLNRVTLLGPFANFDEALVWGKDDANIPYEDDALWHIVDLDEPAFVMQSVP